MGEHRLLCGDALKPEDLARVLGGSLADMTFTDPPYNVDYSGGAGTRTRIANDALGMTESIPRQACSRKAPNSAPRASLAMARCLPAVPW